MPFVRNFQVRAFQIETFEIRLVPYWTAIFNTGLTQLKFRNSVQWILLFWSIWIIVEFCWCYNKIFIHGKLSIFQHKKCRVRNCDLTLFIKIFIWTNDSPLFYWPDFTWNESFLNVNDSRTVILIKTGQLVSDDTTAKRAYGKW